MSTNKRQNSPDNAGEGTDRPHSASPRKKSRLSSITEADREGGRVNRSATLHGTYRPPSAPMQPFRQHHQLHFNSEGTRPASRNKRPANRDKRPTFRPSIEDGRPTSKNRQPLTLPDLSSPNSFPYSGPPELFDVTFGLADAIPPADGEMSYWKTEDAAFIKSAAGLEDASWIGKRPLGSGTFGTAGLWERRDDNNVVIEQIVIKESKTVPADKWTSEVSEVPEEVKMMRRMNNTDCQVVPDLISYKRYVHVRKHRIYMEYCPHGDLATLNLNYKRFRTYFPEPFLWHIFNNLVKVAAAMRDGPDNTNWGYQIVHRDLKPANIFLAEEDSDIIPPCPVAKTGDWGLATKIKQDDPRNPVGLRGAGTKMYYAPEQRILCSGSALTTQINKHLDGTAPLPKISAHTNIWGIGAIMFGLLTHEAVAYYLSDDDWTVNEVLVDIPNFRNPEYSDALIDLIRLCLMPEPWDRPCIEELRLKIEARCQSIRDEYAASPSRLERDRLYYKGSEINHMPPENWNSWRSIMEQVPRPSDPPGPNEPRNPFTDAIVYPRFPATERDGPEEEEAEVVDGDDDENDDGDQDEDTPESPQGSSVKEPNVISHDPPRGFEGNNAENPIILSDSDEEVEVDENGDGDGSNGSNYSEGKKSSEGGSDNSDDSDDSDVRRRMAIKKVPGT